MQQKESKSSWHFWVSFTKSCIRIFAGFAILSSELVTGGISLIVAEALGIIEEF